MPAARAIGEGSVLSGFSMVMVVAALVLQAREVNSAMAEFRTRNTGHVCRLQKPRSSMSSMSESCRLISANDLTGVSKFPAHPSAFYLFMALGWLC